MTRLPIWSWAGRGGWVAAQVRRVCGPSTCGGRWECNTFGVAARRASPEQVEAATDQVVALYTAGVAMQTIVDRTGIGRTSIRKVLLAEGVPRRPTGHPRMAVSSQAVADLYESGLTMTQVAERLRIKPHVAWPRYLEVRDQRGVTPGRWHKVLLDALREASGRAGGGNRCRASARGLRPAPKPMRSGVRLARSPVSESPTPAMSR